jgi:hypothetical protein
MAALWRNVAKMGMAWQCESGCNGGVTSNNVGGQRRQSLMAMKWRGNGVMASMAWRWQSWRNQHLSIMKGNNNISSVMAA